MEFGLEHVTQGYGRHCVLDDVTLSLESGVTALLGPNGAGKSTLMRTLVTDLPPRSGRVVIGGRPLDSGRVIRSARSRIGYLPQDFGFDERFSVEEHVGYLAWLRGVPRSLRSSAALEAMSFVGLAEQRGTRMGALSGGMRQRAGIAGAMVGLPDILVLDEPTVGLDPGQRASFRRLVTALPSSHVLLSTHLTEDVEAVAEHVILLVEGRVTHEGTVEDFRARHGSVEAGYLTMAEAGESPEGPSVP